MNPSGRLARLRAEIETRGWSGAVVTPGVNFAWLTGATVERSERLVCLGVPREAAPWLLAPAFEVERLAEALPDVETAGWREEEDPFVLAAGKMATGDGGTWAVEPSTAYHDAARLAAACPPGIALADGAPAFETLRRSKDAGELAALGRSIDLAWQAWDAVVPGIERGVTEADLARRIERDVAARGGEGWALVQFGPASAVPHGEPADRALEPGQVVLIDWGGWREGFSADLTRTFWWEDEVVPAADAPAEFRAVLDVVRDAQAAALERAAPGVACGDVDRAARDVIERAGYGELFVHRLGHGLGREIHEPPWLVAGNRDLLRPGDVITVEPGIYQAGRFGVRWEDDARVTGDGVEVLSRRADSPR